MAIFFFCGVGGIGMSSIALYLKHAGHSVIGSDRSFDQGKSLDMRRSLEKAGIQIFPQNGSGVSKKIDIFVVSSAVEDSILDVATAKKLQLPIRKRAEVLAGILHQGTGIAVGGTSGKTTVTAMIGHILTECGLNPSMINGGISLNTYHNAPASNLIFGRNDLTVIEADESDGSIQLYTPDIAVVTNISLDHKPIEEIRPLFEAFLINAKKGGVWNADCLETAALSFKRPNLISFSTHGNKADLCATNIVLKQDGARFSVNSLPVFLPLPGRHNVENALAATAAALHMGISVQESFAALASFKGTKRRLEIVETRSDIRVIDDYAHNPEKIKATLQTLQETDGRLFLIYQPHGFGPLRLMRQNLIAMLLSELSTQTFFIMPDVFYAGGTVTKDISSHDIITPLAQAGKKAFYIPDRTAIRTFLKEHIRPKDTVAVVGARDDTLSDFAREIAADFEEKGCHK